MKVLEAVFGKVRRIFRYEAPENSKRATCNLGKFCSFSVEFDSSWSALKSVETRELKLPELEDPIIIEGFKRRNDVKPKPITYFDRPLTDGVPSFSTFCETNPTLNVLSARQKADVNRMPETLSVSSHKQQLLWDRERLLHTEKPTSSKYHALREQSGRNSRMAAHHPAQASINLRFNVGLIFPLFN